MGGLSRGNRLHREGQLGCREEGGRGLWNLLSVGGLGGLTCRACRKMGGKAMFS